MSKQGVPRDSVIAYGDHLVSKMQCFHTDMADAGLQHCLDANSEFNPYLTALPADRPRPVLDLSATGGLVGVEDAQDALLEIHAELMTSIADMSVAEALDRPEFVEDLRKLMQSEASGLAKENWEKEEARAKQQLEEAKAKLQQLEKAFFQKPAAGAPGGDGATAGPQHTDV